MNKLEVTRFRCTTEEKNRIRELAEMHDMKLSEFLLYLVKQKDKEIQMEER